MAGIPSTQSTQYGFVRMDFPVGERGGFVILPAEAEPIVDGPWVWYAPSFVSEPYPLPKDLHAWYFQPVLEAGIAVAGVDVGESWGAPYGRELFTEFYNIVVEKFQLSRKPCLLGQSRGGLMAYNWAVEHPDCVGAIAGIYPVCDVTCANRIGDVSTPYGLTADEIRDHLDEHNPPNRLEPLAQAGPPILHIHGDSDDVVPMDSNSGALIDRYRQLGGQAELIVIEGKGHEEVPEFFQSPRILDFLLEYGRKATS